MFERIMGLDVSDDVEYQRYRDAMLPILTEYGGAFGYDFRIAEVLKSKTEQPINRVFTIAFPSEQVMNDFFTDPRYIEVRDRHLTPSIRSKTVISMHESAI